MSGQKGILIPLSNYTTEPIRELVLKVDVPGPIKHASSALQGALSFQQSTPEIIDLSLPLNNNDFVKLEF